MSVSVVVVAVGSAAEAAAAEAEGSSSTTEGSGRGFSTMPSVWTRRRSNVSVAGMNWFRSSRARAGCSMGDANVS